MFQTLNFLKKSGPSISEAICDSYNRCLIAGLLSPRLVDVQPSSLSQVSAYQESGVGGSTSILSDRALETLRPDNLTPTAFYLLYPTTVFAAPSFIGVPFAVHQPFCHLKCFMRKGTVVINRQGRAVLLLPSSSSLLHSSPDSGRYVGAKNNFKQSGS